MSDQEFISYLVKSFSDLKIPLAEIADIVGVSIPTIQRWCRGKNLPHPIMRAAIINAIHDIGRDK